MRRARCTTSNAAGCRRSVEMKAMHHCQASGPMVTRATVDVHFLSGSRLASHLLCRLLSLLPLPLLFSFGCRACDGAVLSFTHVHLPATHHTRCNRYTGWRMSE